MLIEKPILHKLAEQTVKDLRRDGIEPTPEEILWLHSAAVEMARPTPCDSSTFLDFPIICGNVTLLPLSIGAKEWLRLHADWFDGDDILFQLAEAFCMAQGRNPESFDGLTNRVKAVAKVLVWARKIDCSAEELSRAMNYCLNRKKYVDIKNPKEEKEEAEGIAHVKSATDWGQIHALLSHFYPGHSLSYWLWELSDDAVAELIEKTNSFLPPEQRVDRDSKRCNQHSIYCLIVGYIRKAHAPAVVDNTPGAPGVEGSIKVNDNARPDQVPGQPPDQHKTDEVKNPPKNAASHELPQAGNEQGSPK